MSSRIVIVDPDGSWQDDFQVLARALRTALGDLALRIDHIGSTSVPGLPAKDVIDIQVTVELLDGESISSRLATVGYARRMDIARDHVPPGDDSDPDQWRKLYYRAPEGQRPTHLHVRQHGKLNQRYPLLFRDYLRANPDAAEAYAQVKKALARLHPDDADAYYDIKDPVCDLIVQSAERWAAVTQWTQGECDA